MTFPRIFVFGLVFFLAGCASSPRVLVESAAVMTESGKSVPVQSSEATLRWLNIPFAKPPVGALRWRAPVRLAPREGLIQAKTDSVL